MISDNSGYNGYYTNPTGLNPVEPIRAIEDVPGSKEEKELKKVVIITAPFEVERTGDMAYVHALESMLKDQGIDTSYVRAADYPEIEKFVPKALNTSPNVTLKETYDALSTIGSLLVQRIISDFDPKNTVINLHLRVPHTGFAFGKEALEMLKGKGFKICLTIHEFRSNEGQANDSERRFQTLELFSQGLFDQLHMFNRRDLEEFEKSCYTGLTDFERECQKAPSVVQSSLAWQSAPSVYDSAFKLSKNISSNDLDTFFDKNTTLLNIPDLMRTSFQYTIENLQNREPNIMLLGMIRLDKGEDAAIELASGLKRKGLPNRVKIVGRVSAIPSGVAAISKLLKATFGERYTEQHIKRLQDALMPHKGESVEDHTVRFNALVSTIIKELGEPDLPMDFHIDLSDDEVVKISESCKFGIKYDWKGMADNSSCIVNMMGGGLIVFANRGFLTDNQVYKTNADKESPLVMRDQESHEDPQVSYILDKLQEYNDHPEIVLAKQSKLKSLMETRYSQQIIGPSFATMFKTTLNS